MNNYDALIIGAGPAGNRVAYKLANLGHKVAVFEKHEKIGGKLCCTGIIGTECMDLFEIDRSCVLQHARSAKLFAPSGEFLRVSKNEPQAYIVDRSAFDRNLAQRAKNEGTEYFLSSRVNDISVSIDGVELKVDQHGDTRSFQGKTVVIAGGFASSLPGKLGMGQIKNRIIGAQAEVETNGIDEVEVYFSQKIAPGFFAWLAPISKNSARVGLFARENPGEYLQKLLAQLSQQGKVSAAEADITYGGIPLKPLPRTFGDRVLVVGDTAGQVKPTTGGGIYYGMLCADFASEILHQAFSSNDFTKNRFKRYDKLWKDKLGRELQIDYFARSFYGRLSDKRINSIFQIVKDNNIHEDMLNSSYSSFDWHGQLVLDGLKRLTPWQYLFGKYIPGYIIKSLRGK
ncbi:MAG: NAD(P)/FAD-dependent oxidoreductase [Chloroflexota bacterium]|nr:NAD(P)/FAD-dependent oxidoreductase [Chloroflexota bacterium]